MLGTLKPIHTSELLISNAMSLFSIKLQTTKNEDEQNSRAHNEKEEEEEEEVDGNNWELSPVTLTLSFNLWTLVTSECFGSAKRGEAEDDEIEYLRTKGAPGLSWSSCS